MKILFAPSETKTDGGTLSPIIGSTFHFYHKEKMHVSEKYHRYLKDNDVETLQKLFGIKNIETIQTYKAIDIYHDCTKPAILRYTGVAYDYLDYPSLADDAKAAIDTSMIIFSNLFGAILASEPIPNYKLKQGEKLDGFAIERYYKKETSAILDDYLEGELIIDLRAGFYEKFYTPTHPYITMKFIKDGKVVSHWAKAYRGKVVRTLAQMRPNNEKELLALPFENLELKEILTKGVKKELVFHIC